MNLLELRNELETLLAAELGTYTLPNDATTPAISVRSSGENLPTGTTATGLEVVIIRDPDLTPIPQYSDAGALRTWTIFLVDWSDAVDLEPIGAYLIEAFPGTQTSTVAVPRTGGPQNQLRVSILANSQPAEGFPPFAPVSFPTVDAIAFTLDADIEVGEGQLTWNADEKTLDLGKGGGVVLQIGQEQLSLVRNSTASTIPNGRAVMFAGTVGNSGRLLVAPMVANGTYPGYVFFGVTTAAIAPGADGFVCTFGKVRGVNTTAYDEGDILWCSPTTPGTFTVTEPLAPNLKLPVVAVISSANNGTLFVRSTAGNRLQDLHDVEANGTKDDGDLIHWSAADNRWEPTDRLTLLEQRVTALEALHP